MNDELFELTRRMLTVAATLSKGNVTQRTWAKHLTQDAASILLMAQADSARSSEPAPWLQRLADGPERRPGRFFEEGHRCSIATCGASGLGTWCQREPEPAEVTPS